jgi:hypothetical protein
VITPTVTLTLERIDWDELRLGKIHLVSKIWSDKNSPAWSVIALLDHLQDQAVAAGVPERDVFGPEPPDVEG